jgi:hypothetical protein
MRESNFRFRVTTFGGYVGGILASESVLAPKSALGISRRGL